MYGEARKLHLIEEILKVENDDVLLQVESLLANSKHETNARTDFNTFAGMMSDKEADAFEKAIESGCETINPDDWK